jgi:hypothetical protein
MNKKGFNTTAIAIGIVASAVLILAAPNLSQTKRPPLKGGVSQNEQQGDVFNSNSRRDRPCDPNDCPCHAAQAVAFHEKDCDEHLADFDKKIEERQEEIRQINAYPQMRKSKINPAKDPSILQYRYYKAQYQKYCECSKKYLEKMCSLSPEEFNSMQAECSETGGTPYRPYPREEEERPTSPRRDPLGFPSADAGTLPAPRIVYKPKCGRSLLFVNNPELLESVDFADDNTHPKTVFEATVTKPSRIFFEHANGEFYPIGYNIQLFNPNETPVEVTINGSGFVTAFHNGGDIDTAYHGGEPFRQLFEQEKSPPRVIKVGKRESIWLIDPKLTQIPARVFFSGVVDFEVRGGPVSIRALGYRNINKIDGKAKYEGYIDKYHRGSDESRNYKGKIDCAELVAEGVDFTIDDSNKPGPLDVQFTSRKKGLTTNSQWHTHSIRNGEAIKGDVLDLMIPPDEKRPKGELIRAEKPWADNIPPNLGNWGVVYTLKGNVTNNGSHGRCISIKLQLERAAIAWRDRDGKWKEQKFKGRDSKEYYTFPVRAGRRVPFEAKFVLGGPSGTDLLHSVSILKDAQSCQ